MEDYTTMHWAFSAVKATVAMHGNQKLFTVASGVTPSGTIHIGNFREIITNDLIKRAFKYMDKKVRYIHSWDDNDVFRKVPKNMPNQEMLKNNLRKCIVDIPDPYGEYESYAMKHMKDVENSVAKVGIFPKYIYQSTKYRNCDYADEIKVALENTEKIKSILDEYRKEPLEETWLPVSVFCDACQKDTITKLEWRKNYTLYYECECGHKEEFDFRKKGITKLLWRIDWPMRWNYENTNCEPAGKDHFTKGGSRESGVKIQENVWKTTAPYGFMYDFIQIKGGSGKISSSSGDVVTLQDCLQIYEPEIIRYLFASTRPNTEFAISFDADVIKIHEDYDKCERIYYGKEASEKEKAKQKLIYEFSQVDEDLKKIPKKMLSQISFRHITTILQIKSMDVEATLQFFNRRDNKLKTRITCVKNWLENFADEQFKFSVKKEKDNKFLSSLDETQTKAIASLKEAIEKNEDEERLSKAIFDIPTKLNIEMKDFFALCYSAIIGKEKGPKLANFILEIGKEQILKLL